MNCEHSPYTLPTIDFVGGETQRLAFNIYHGGSKRPCGLDGCTSNFSIVSYTNKYGDPIVKKSMTIDSSDGQTQNMLTVVLTPTESVDLYGKYIYQIIIKDTDGDTEVKQGIMYISNNIHKDYFA